MSDPLKANTLSYSEDVKGWPSFYSFLPDYMCGMNGFFYSWSGGNLYRHNTNPLRNNYYGVQYSSTIQSVFNVEPQTIKLFKTMSYESNDAWNCTGLFTDLNTGSMPGTGPAPIQTWFVQKEGEWFSFLRENSTTTNFRDRSSNGIGASNSVIGPLNAIVINFNLQDLGSIVTVGDQVYSIVSTVPPATPGVPTFVGAVTNIVRQQTTDVVTGVVTLPSITVDTVGPYPPVGTPLPYPFPGVVPPIGDFILIIKDPIAASNGARGYFMNFTLQNDNTEAVELFSVGSSSMKSNP
ncbi:MAG: putative structural protein [Prokaryotic dsDNA virus sp.]|nr:MAG: putative structural protein [Prokaryotic dsDNA virus sp.]|tara:strand:- start:20502 stop:21383 length:882 start_codon:yes stop_codon:yes gene_type:complete